MALLAGLLIYLTPVVLCVVAAVFLWNKSNKAALNTNRRNNYRIAASVLVLIGAAIVTALFYGG